MTHLLDVVDVRSHQRKEGPKFGAIPKFLEMPLFGIPFDAQDVVRLVLSALREFVYQAILRGR